MLFYHAFLCSGEYEILVFFEDGIKIKKMRNR
jgi:hypothetical protein